MAADPYATLRRAVMWVAADRRERESQECLRVPHILRRAHRAQQRAEATLEELERLELDWAAAEATLRGDCPTLARTERALELALSRGERLRLAFCDAVLAGT